MEYEANLELTFDEQGGRNHMILQMCIGSLHDGSGLELLLFQRTKRTQNRAPTIMGIDDRYSAFALDIRYMLRKIVGRIGHAIQVADTPLGHLFEDNANLRVMHMSACYTCTDRNPLGDA